MNYIQRKSDESVSEQHRSPYACTNQTVDFTYDLAHSHLETDGRAEILRFSDRIENQIFPFFTSFFWLVFDRASGGFAIYSQRMKTKKT